jgi:GNAT superfamily N-acetyltransferase
MNNYTFRQAVMADAEFLCDVIIHAEKSNSDKLSFSSFFNITEETAKSYIISMLEEEVEDCELSISSFLIAAYDGKPVGAFGGWIEALNQPTASGFLKSNLIGFTFGRERIEFLKSKSYLLKNLIVERQPLTLQLEYLFVSENHRGKKLADTLIEKLISRGVNMYAALNKVQVQVYKNNDHAIKLYERNGFTEVRSYKCEDPEIFNYLPYNEKIMMEKSI